ncbi:DNA replication initiation control protein YabA [Pediococcus inopinatus]|uniref:Replication initiation control protein YabA n=2 Tax=Pediococcus inopinatus TaxID=114090 RepID=A0ABZ0Q2Y7_9LACO|nr:DNA replication initiation control protein YabA [Pediococcus inopinatus]AVL00426.1 DNA replication initiation control protein YabA [Pediococcus inopinatus]KRN62842.1 hypothetical protein IV83_GL001718 [Pediococcus inopinatus]WPC18084.1 DNA replication initiation control protein YabA [Pediococcus inopinatus]WPC19641.1 DNA replication initiation control protein YabA [Pediococcus inopinatus]WPC21338.1 DNA replication initiation control protein YabA [Pediococcus inopinatus]
MNKREIYESFDGLQEESQKMSDQIQELQNGLTEILEENAELVIENEHLREQLSKYEQSSKNEDPKSTKHGLSKSRKNLEKLYGRGYHVCNEWFGRHRENNEPCAFCLDVIYGDR